MPYDKRKVGDKWEVFNTETGQVRGRTRSEKKAKRFMAALYANAPDAGKASDPGALLVGFGGAVKALDDAGGIEGDLVVFGSPDETDLTRHRDYFTSETDFGRALKDGGLDLVYHHALPFVGPEPNPLADRVLADVAIKADDARVWITGQMALRDEYERSVFAMIKAGKMGLSSGADPFRMRRQRQPNGSSKVTAWPLIHAALTPTPADPKTWVGSVKTLDDFDPAAAAALKSLIEGGHDAPESGGSVVETLHRAVSVLDWASGQRNLNAVKSAAIDAVTEAVRRCNASRIDDGRVRAGLELANRLLNRPRG